jgi:hypothetical protein
MEKLFDFIKISLNFCGDIRLVSLQTVIQYSYLLTYLLTYLLKNLFNHAGHTQHICKNTMS